MKRQAMPGGAAVEDSMDASPEAAEAGFFVDKQDPHAIPLLRRGMARGRLVSRLSLSARKAGFTPKPGLAGGNSYGEVEGGPGLHDTGRADEKVEAGAGEQAFDGPLSSGRVGVGIVCGVEDAGFFFGVFDGFHAGVDFFDHFEVEVFGGLDEGVVTGTAAAAGDLVYGVGDVDPLDGQARRQGFPVVVLDEAADVFGGRGVGLVGLFAQWNPREQRMMDEGGPHPAGLAPGTPLPQAGEGVGG